jgi:hypothetical protein
MEWVLFIIFAIFPFLLMQLNTNELHTFLNPNLVVKNPALANDDSYSVNQSDGKYDIAINLAYRESHYYTIDFNHLIDNKNNEVSDDKYDLFFDSHMLDEKNEQYQLASHGLK